MSPVLDTIFGRLLVLPSPHQQPIAFSGRKLSRTTTTSTTSLTNKTPRLLVRLVLLMAAGVSVGVSGARIPAETDNSVDRRSELPRDCAPVPHDILWLRLNLDVAAHPVTSDEDDGYESAPSADQRSATMRDRKRNSNSATSRTNRRRRQVERFDSSSNETTSELIVDEQQQQQVVLVSSGDMDRHQVRHPLQHRRRRRHANKRKQKNVSEAIVSNMQPEVRRKTEQHADNNAVTVVAAIDSRGNEAWHCHMESHWQRQPEGTFPPYLQTGRCRQKKCMAGLYECRPRKYSTRVLRRLPGKCNPIPLGGTGLSSSAAEAFEEAWIVEEVKVTVGCECTKLRQAGTYYNGPSR